MIKEYTATKSQRKKTREGMVKQEGREGGGEGGETQGGESKECAHHRISAPVACFVVIRVAGLVVVERSFIVT